MELKKLYVDGLNVATSLGFGSKWWNIEEPRQGVKKFVEAARNSGYELKVFIDAGIQSAEAMEKWKSRRENDVLCEKVGVITCMSSLLGELFTHNGVEVLYSPQDADCDDCIAYFAQRDGADILSQDADFFRYEGKEYDLYGTFRYENEGITLSLRKTVLKLPEPRQFFKEEPHMHATNPVFGLAKDVHILKRGVPSSLVKMLGNVHAHLSTLRASVYYNLGISEPVTEMWPEWDGQQNQVVWRKSSNTPTDMWKASLLTQPSTHYNLVSGDMGEPNEALCADFEISNHNLSVALLVCEVYAHFKGSSMIEVFESDPVFVELEKKAYQEHMKSPHRLPNPCRNWKTTGECKFGDKCSWKESHFLCGCRRGKNCPYRHA